jgi:hypothetical protein
MLFSLQKKHKIQPKFFNDFLWTGKVLDDFVVHPDPNIPKNALGLAVAQVENKIKWTLHDIYTIPRFEDIGDVMSFFQKLEWIELTERFKEDLVRDICLAYKLSVEYLKREWYYVPSTLWKPPRTTSDIVKIAHKWRSYVSAKDKIGYCTLLKEILGFFRIIRCGKFWINYTDGSIDLRNKDFMKKIIEAFDGKEFKYPENTGRRFSKESSEMSGYLMINRRQIPIYAGFRVKSVDAMIEKMDSQEKYNIPEVFKDIHGMRIEVKTKEDALHVASFLYKWIWHDGDLENIGWFIDESTYKNFIMSGYLLGNETFRDKLAELLSRPVPKKKNYSEDRTELKITRKWSEPIEIQIVTVDNTNETGWGHHDIYKIRRKIVAKIRRHGWIGKSGIKFIIKKTFEENKKRNNGHNTIWRTEETVLEHIMNLPNFLIWIRGASEFPSHKNGTHHFSTKETIEKYKINHPTNTKKDIISVEMKSWSMQAMVPLSTVVFFPSSP